LVNAFFASLPLFYMSFFFLSQWVVDQIDRLRRAFFWKGDRSITCGHSLACWDLLCSPRVNGGLGIYRVRDFNI